MRHLDPKPKEKRDVAIPDALQESLAEAWEIICDADSDEDVRIDFDDAIQCERLCGGRSGQGPRDFSFTFYPEPHTRWLLELSRREIQDIADGHQTTLSLFCCTGCNAKFSRADARCSDCDDSVEPAGRARVPGLDLLEQALQPRQPPRTARAHAGAKANQLVTNLLEEDLLELVTSRNRASLVSHIAELLESGADVPDVANALEDAEGVAELYASDDDIRRLLS